MKSIYLVISLFVVSLSAQAAREAVEVCNYIASYSASSGVDCVKIIAPGGYFDPNATDLCYTVAQYSSTSGVSCLAAIANNRFQMDAVGVCSFIASYSYTSGPQCLSAIANKAFLNGTASVCKTIAQNSTNSALTCLQQSGVPDNKVCPTLKDISTGIDGSLNAIFNGTPRAAVSILQDLQAKINMCL